MATDRNRSVSIPELVLLTCIFGANGSNAIISNGMSKKVSETLARHEAELERHDRELLEQQAELKKVNQRLTAMKR